MRSQGYSVYRAATALASPLLALWLRWRLSQGKEDAARLSERFGHASQPRPQGRLLWLHAASVGEASSVLYFISTLREQAPRLAILVTTGTVTSARLMQARLPHGVIHQFAPIDTPQAARRFIRHWRPNFAFWVESEFWPNLIFETNASEAFMGILNGRLSERSFASWRRLPGFARAMLRCFDIAFAQTEADAARLMQLGARQAVCLGNLKFDAKPLPGNDSDLLSLQRLLAGRPVWLAASTHPGEEEIIAQADRLLRATRPNLLTVIVPRHPSRGDEIAAKIAVHASVAQRSKKQLPESAAAFYIADTLGELGLFYRLSEVVFMGGSLVRHGGQNPLEPARFSCALLAGAHTHNFADIYDDMERQGLCLRVGNAAALAAQAGRLMGDGEARHAMAAKLRQWVEAQSGATARIAGLLAPLLNRT